MRCIVEFILVVLLAPFIFVCGMAFFLALDEIRSKEKLAEWEKALKERSGGKAL